MKTNLSESRRIITALLLMLVALTLLLPGSVSAQTNETEPAGTTLPEAAGVTARLITDGLITDGAPLTVGDPALLTLEVTHPAGHQVFVPKIEGQWGEFEIQEQSIQEDRVERRRQ